MTLNWRTEDGGIWNPYKNKEMKKNVRMNELETELETIFAFLADDAEWVMMKMNVLMIVVVIPVATIHHLIDQLQQEFNREYAKYGITRSFLPDEEREAWK